MMRKFIFTLLAFFPFFLFAQRTIYIRAIAGNYRMKDMKAIQNEIKSDIRSSGIPVKAVSSFPISIQGEIGMDFTVYDSKLREYIIGGFINYAITEGRIHYADYSGSVSAVQNLNRIALGFKAAKNIYHDFDVYGKVGAHYTSYKLRIKTTLQNGKPDDEEIEFNASGLFFEPGIQWNKTIRQFRFIINAGYEVNVNSKTMYGDSYLQDNEENPVKIDWSGFRLGSGIAFAF
jgi:hypothetical protein